jgi:hypothetical protein
LTSTHIQSQVIEISGHTYRQIAKMLTRKRALAEVNANDSRDLKPAKRLNRDLKNASVPPEFREKSTEASFTSESAHVGTQQRVCR